MLRQINKYFSQYIPDVVNRYSNALLDLLNNGKTQIVKNILRFIKEIFDKGQEINIEKAIYKRVGPVKKLFSLGITAIKLIPNGDILVGTG